ncbi:MAG: hypothetical protein ACYCVN_09350 [Acidimicrobiales bacterium]
MAASLVMLPSSAGAAPQCVSGSVTEPGCVTVPVANVTTGGADGGNAAGGGGQPTQLPFTGPDPHLANTTTSSLPFTGADVGELAAIGAGAVLAGVVLSRRRRHAA